MLLYGEQYLVLRTIERNDWYNAAQISMLHVYENAQAKEKVLETFRNSAFPRSTWQ